MSKIPTRPGGTAPASSEPRIDRRDFINGVAAAALTSPFALTIAAEAPVVRVEHVGDPARGPSNLGTQWLSYLRGPRHSGDYWKLPVPNHPREPVVVHMERNPNHPGLPRKEQQRLGRIDMLTTPFEKIEAEIRSQLNRMLGAGGFNAKRDILAITVNRWPHGYAYTYDTLGDPEIPESQRPHVPGRRAFGRIAIANADSGAAAFTNMVIDQAQRAVQDCLASRGLI